MSLSKNETILSGGEVVPQSRIEKILVGEDIEPQSRIEALLKEKLCGGGGGSVPKPLTYDYMPEGYPTKTVQTTTLIEYPTVPFQPSTDGTRYRVTLPNPFEVVAGQTYTVNWDGTEYECIGVTPVANIYIIGNLSIAGVGNDTGEPFLYEYEKDAPSGQFSTLDTAASHAISVKTIKEIVTPMAEEFLPATAKNTTVFYYV